MIKKITFVNVKMLVNKYGVDISQILQKMYNQNEDKLEVIKSILVIPENYLDNKTKLFIIKDSLSRSKKSCDFVVTQFDLYISQLGNEINEN